MSNFAIKMCPKGGTLQLTVDVGDVVFQFKDVHGQFLALEMLKLFCENCENSFRVVQLTNAMNQLIVALAQEECGDEVN